ncbi:MAG TPA: hypothetical protein VHY48_11915 [Acidobacteriaceae bacterium]|jgi:hypothetical protein|nr:hypothetical protein [Acidobacteriaceae bacterium]
MANTIASRYLVVYSAVVTAAFIVTVYFGFIQPVHGAQRTADFDRIRVHRIDLVEPDGTVRLILSNRADFPGSFFHDKEIQRPDRADAAGLLFINDEGTEDGGLIYGGKLVNGQPSSFGHLSFDQYDQDQTLSLGSSLQDGTKVAAFTLNDMPDFALSPAVIDEVEKVKSMPHGLARAAAWAALQKKFHSFGQQRASLARSPDGSVGLTLDDPEGRPRLRLRVASDGTPSLDLLDANGKVTRSLDAH